MVVIQRNAADGRTPARGYLDPAPLGTRRRLFSPSGSPVCTPSAPSSRRRAAVGRNAAGSEPGIPRNRCWSPPLQHASARGTALASIDSTDNVAKHATVSPAHKKKLPGPALASMPARRNAQLSPSERMVLVRADSVDAARQ